MGKLLNGLEYVLRKLVVIAIGLMLVLVFMQVISRYLFSYTPSFNEELSRYLFVWVVFLSLPLVAKTGGHMAIETITSRIHGVWLKSFRIAADVFSAIFLGVMTWYGIDMVMLTHFQTSPAMVIPMSYVYSVIPFGCGVMLLYVLQNLWEVLRTPAEHCK